MIAEPIRRPRLCAPDERIVVVHGFAGKRLWMCPLGFRLRAAGFRVTNWGYASWWCSVERHAVRFHEYLLSLGRERRIHIVAHSMGAIVVRAALSIGVVANLGRVVLFAPPNHGSPVARRAERLLGGVITGIAELSDRPDSFVNRLPELSAVEVAIVAAKYDMLVPVDSTHLTGEREHVVLNATHNSLLLSPVAAWLASSFITTGRWDRPE